MFFSVDFHHKLYNATICSWEGLWQQCRHAEIVWRWRRTFEQRKHNFSDVFYLCRFIFFLFLCIWTILWCRPLEPTKLNFSDVSFLCIFFISVSLHWCCSFEQTKHDFSDVFYLCRFFNFSFSAYSAALLGKILFSDCLEMGSPSLWFCKSAKTKYNLTF